MTTNNDAARLLLWFLRESGGSTLAIKDPAESAEWQEMGDERVIVLLGILEDAGYLVQLPSMSACGTQASMTARGVSEAERLARVRDSPMERIEFAAVGLIEAAMQTYPECQLSLESFILSDRMFFLGTVLELDAVLRAVALLQKHKLVTVHDGDRGTPPQGITLTTLGIECGSAADISVRDFMSQQQKAKFDLSGSTFHGPSQFGDGNIQHNTYSATPQQLADFAQQVLAAATTMDVTQSQREDIVQDAETLHRESARDEPEQGRLRRALDGLMASLRQVASDQTAQGLVNIGLGLMQ
ncbi:MULTISPECIES: hypothetical protein [unclassified Streptomyces]|uniref:hypothetical protein n=1 Tax=unclassified Streptomyces TaxID=2593676 RepID=UPI0029A2C5D4|nr:MULTISPECIES: hypothetical protein [unclassified Streptomyces]MDX3772458.1 hypothetical protein [Streptomyces sp. AK08-01B]MDX3821958.1 hypothetical protein [Streptomyces sp. AK08-01A]